MGVDDILGNSDGPKHPGCIISSVAPHRTYFGKKYDRAQNTFYDQFGAIV